MVFRRAVWHPDRAVRRGWLGAPDKDRFGVSWQVIPRQMGDYLGGVDPEGNRRAMEAMLATGKLDIEGLRRAYEGTTG